MAENENQNPEGATESTTETVHPDALAKALYGEKPAQETATETKTPGESIDDLRSETEGKPIDGSFYQLKAPEGVAVNREMLGEFETLAREYKMSPAAAQRLADLHLKSVGDAVREIRAEQDERLQEVKAWSQEFTEDPTYGGSHLQTTVAAARNALSHFGTPAEVERLKAELNSTGLGNHPVMIKGLARIARLLGTVAAPKANKEKTEKTIAQILYPNDS